MNAFANLRDRLINGGTFIGAVFLIAGMLLLISNILGRFINFVIPGSYELFELFMVVPVAVALVYTALKDAHVVVNILVSRFPRWLSTISEMAASLLSFATWGFITYAGAHLAFENGLKETTDILGIPYLPFRIVWVICLFIFSLIYLYALFRVVGRIFKK